MQTYASCAARDHQTATDRLLACVAGIDKWMSSNWLKLNADKAEFLIVAYLLYRVVQKSRPLSRIIIKSY